MQIIEVTGFGVRSAVIRLRRRDTPLQFVLYPMLHLAEASFYQQVTRRLKDAHVIVAEGVKRGSRRRSVLGGALQLSYSVARFNRRVELVEQDIDYQSLGVPVVTPDVTEDEFRASWRRIPLLDRMMMWMALPVVILIRLFGGAEALWTRDTEVSDLPSPEEEVLAEQAPEIEAAFGGERDQRLLGALYQLHQQRHDEAIEVAVVYGAGHTAALVHGLMDRYGYRARSADWLTVANL